MTANTQKPADFFTQFITKLDDGQRETITLILIDHVTQDIPDGGSLTGLDRKVFTSVDKRNVNSIKNLLMTVAVENAKSGGDVEMAQVAFHMLTAVKDFEINGSTTFCQSALGFKLGSREVNSLMADILIDLI